MQHANLEAQQQQGLGIFRVSEAFQLFRHFSALGQVNGIWKCRGHVPDPRSED